MEQKTEKSCLKQFIHGLIKKNVYNVLIPYREPQVVFHSQQAEFVVKGEQCCTNALLDMGVPK